MNKPIIKFNNVSKTYFGNTEPTLKSISFSVEEGEFFCIVGPSGCGKSTILKIIAGLDTPDKGPESGQVIKPENVSMVFQSGALLPWLNVYENVAFGLHAKTRSENKIKESVEKYIAEVGLSGLEIKYPRELSGGQRQRVGLARALAVEPKVLLLDEPFSALDAVTTEGLHKDLLKIWHASNHSQTNVGQETLGRKTIVMVSHSIEEAVALVDKIMLVKDGKIDKIFEIKLPYPRREQAENFMRDVQEVRKEFFK